MDGSYTSNELCFVCGEETNNSEANRLGSVSKYQKISIHALLSQIIEPEIRSFQAKGFEHISPSACLCLECKEQIDLYDYGAWIRKKTVKELRRVYKAKVQLKLKTKEAIATNDEVYEEEYLEEDEQDNQDNNGPFGEHYTESSYKKSLKAENKKQNRCSSNHKTSSNRKKINELRCHLCFLQFSRKEKLEAHLKSHQGLDPLQCPICFKTYTTKGILVRHMPIHSNEKRFVCSTCGKYFVHYGSFDAHNKAIHDKANAKKYECGLCGKVFLHHGSFRTHKLAHENKKDKTCLVCGVAFIRTSHLNRHIKTHTNEKLFKCHCGARFAEKYNLTAHTKIHEGSTATKFLE